MKPFAGALEQLARREDDSGDDSDDANTHDLALEPWVGELLDQAPALSRSA
jgi:hypothetical protein